MRVLTGRGGRKIDLSERKYLGADGLPKSDGLISFFKPEHISALLCNFPALKFEMKGRF